ncbi:hypothetical protein G2W53_003214 [Senna tora]|uniref:Uncharacterized protein n=1 Tax=Senna tora TaxID=362788 RepID=A0A835CGQ8_9FABA|nr:hypothetical protein G2W53_003214 [Senna tora]
MILCRTTVLALLISRLHISACTPKSSTFFINTPSFFLISPIAIFTASSSMAKSMFFNRDSSSISNLSIRTLILSNTEIQSLQAVLKVLLNEFKQLLALPYVFLAFQNHFDNFLIHIQKAFRDLFQRIERKSSDFNTNCKSVYDLICSGLECCVKGLQISIKLASSFIRTQLSCIVHIIRIDVHGR